VIVSIYSGDSGDYSICPEEEFMGCGYKVDVTQKFFDRYMAYEAEQEFIQSKLHRYYTEAKQKQTLENSKQGIQPKGF
jgi:hypothetical protein